MEVSVFTRINKWFWNEYVWLPPNITWADYAKTDKVKYAQFNDLYYALLVALLLWAIRMLLERCIFTPIGIRCGLKTSRPKLIENVPLLEKAYKSKSSLTHKQVEELAKKLDWSERKVERWIRYRTLQNKSTTLAKFTESAWRFTFYISSFVYGLWTLSDKPWLWETRFCWYDYPHHSVTNDVWWYYMIELGFYWSLTFSQFMDIRRKDFFQMFVHHIVTIMLLSFSWACNLTRIGTLVLIVHDFADCPLEAAKMAKYIKNQALADVMFAVFTLSWVISRLGLYPYRVIYSTMFEAVVILELEMFPAYYIFNTLLCSLQVLHIVWTYMIYRVTMQAFSSKQVHLVRDIRSEESESCDSNASSNETEMCNGQVSKKES